MIPQPYDYLKSLRCNNDPVQVDARPIAVRQNVFHPHYPKAPSPATGQPQPEVVNPLSEAKSEIIAPAEGMGGHQREGNIGDSDQGQVAGGSRKHETRQRRDAAGQEVEAKIGEQGILQRHTAPSFARAECQSVPDLQEHISFLGIPMTAGICPQCNYMRFVGIPHTERDCRPRHRRQSSMSKRDSHKRKHGHNPEYALP